MKRIALALLLALSACGRESETPTAPVEDVSTLRSPRISGRLYTCDVTYSVVRGHITDTSRATVRMGVDLASTRPGWEVEAVTVQTPLADAQGFDPWLAFLPGAEQPFLAMNGAVLTLSEIEAAPLTFDTTTGALDWSKAGLLGDTSYAGSCY
jgi:hypothetical protein